MNNKYGARRTYSNLCQREFASKAEAQRGEELFLFEKAGSISDLEFQPRWTLCLRPKITYAADFRYKEDGKTVVEDKKGVLTRDTRTKLAWLEEKYGINVILT